MKAVRGKHWRGEENRSFRCSGIQAEVNRFHHQGPCHHRQASGGIPDFITGCQKEDYHTANDGLPGGPGSKTGAAPGSWPPPPASLSAANEGRPAKCCKHPNLDRPRAPPEAPVRGPRGSPGSGERGRRGAGAREAQARTRPRLRPLRPREVG